MLTATRAANSSASCQDDRDIDLHNSRSMDVVVIVLSVVLSAVLIVFIIIIACLTTKHQQQLAALRYGDLLVHAQVLEMTVAIIVR